MIFSTCIVPSDQFQGKVLAKMVMMKASRKVAVDLSSTNDYGVASAPLLSRLYKALGGEVVATKSSTRKEELPTVF